MTSFLGDNCTKTVNGLTRVFNDRDCAPSIKTRFIVGAFVTGFVVCKCAKGYKNWKERKELQQRVRERQIHREQNLKNLIEKISVNGILVTPGRQEILDLTSELLLQKLNDGSLKAIDVLRAYQAKAIEATKKCNCVIEFLTEAEDWAKAVDLIPSSAEYPLKGLPVSIKEDLAIANYDSTVGYARFLGNKATKDSVIVASLKRLGAVPFCRTNMVQTLLGYSASNPIYGHTSHPTHSGRGPGGSSGGEGALIALGGSILGVGTDIGGSVRIPAHCCGIPSLKPTMGRIIATGQFDALPGVQGMNNSPGLLGQDVDTVIIAAKSLFSTGILHEIDPRSLPIPWREQMFNEPRKLRIGYYDDSNVFPALPGCKRALHIAVDAMTSAGHEVLNFPCPDSFDSVHRMVQLFEADGGKFMLQKWKNDTIEPVQKEMYDVLVMPKWFRLHVFKRYVQFFTKKSFIVGDISAEKLWQLMVERRKMTDDVIRQWKTLKLDVILTPGFAFPAIPSEYTTTLFAPVTYTMLYNHLDFPAGIVPVTHESAQDQADLESYDTMGDQMLELAKKISRGGEGLPIGVQVVGLPWQEELVLRTMKEIQDILPIPFVRNMN